MTTIDSTPRNQPGQSTKVTGAHQAKLAVVYVRQSTPRQVLDHQESRERQYALADQAVTLGWPKERVLIIDEDQGRSGKTAENRLGFHRLLAEVTMDHVGLILGLEMSRLARSSKDWHHLLELSAVFGSLLADQDGVYDPNDTNDRLLLGLKGTISEFELCIMRNRLERGKLNKARRGELIINAPVGYVKTPTGGLALDPDDQVRAVVRLIFDKFDELGTAHAVTRYLRQNHIRLGIRPHEGPNRGNLEWRQALVSTV
jgi:DNA invertase Pin-like site-specific DNA recombinase